MTKARNYCVFCLILALFMAVHGAFAQQSEMLSFRRDDYGLSFSYPSHMIPAKAENSQVLFLLHTREGYFPTFNVLVQPGNPKVEEKSVLQLKADVVDSYRGVGLYDAEVRFSEKRRVAGRTVFFAKVYYTLEKAPLVAGVYILPGKNRYFAGTFVSRESRFDEDEHYLNEIMQTFSLNEQAPPPPSTKEPVTALMWIAVLFVVLISAKIVHVIFKRGSRQ